MALESKTPFDVPWKHIWIWCADRLLDDPLFPSVSVKRGFFLPRVIKTSSNKLLHSVLALFSNQHEHLQPLDLTLSEYKDWINDPRVRSRLSKLAKYAQYHSPIDFLLGLQLAHHLNDPLLEAQVQFLLHRFCKENPSQALQTYSLSMFVW